jgi:hypothetical protein
MHGQLARSLALARHKFITVVTVIWPWTSNNLNCRGVSAVLLNTFESQRSSWYACLTFTVSNSASSLVGMENMRRVM